MLTATATTPAAAPAPLVRGPDRRHTGWVLASCLALMLAWSGSGLGVWPLLLTVLSLCSLLTAGVIWLVLLIHAGAARRRLAGRFAVAPVLVAVAAGLLHADVPGLLRFRLTEGAFDQAVAEDGAFVGSWLGSYRIDETRSIGHGTFFFDHDGSVFDYAGFAYLPTGPSSAMSGSGFESPEFQHLYGHWYTFSASW